MQNLKLTRKTSSMVWFGNIYQVPFLQEDLLRNFLIPVSLSQFSI